MQALDHVEDASAVISSRSPVGSSANSSRGLLTSARSQRHALLLAAREFAGPVVAAILSNPPP